MGEIINLLLKTLLWYPFYTGIIWVGTGSCTGSDFDFATRKFIEFGAKDVDPPRVRPTTQTVLFIEYFRLQCYKKR